MKRGLRLSGHLGLSSPDKPLLAHLGRSPAPLDQIDVLADRSFAGVQDLFLKLRPAAEQTAMAERMHARGLSLSSFGGDPAHWNTPLWTSGNREALRESVAASASIARRFGGAGAVCVAGLDPERSHAEQLRAMIENLKHVADEAARANLVLLVEPIAPQRISGMLPDRLEAAEEVVRGVDRPCVRLMFDIGHVAMMGHPVPQALAACGDIISVVQVADVLGSERVDPGSGTLDWREIGGALAKLDYKGLIELEYEPLVPTRVGEEAMLRRLANIMGD